RELVTNPGPLRPVEDVRRGRRPRRRLLMGAEVGGRSTSAVEARRVLGMRVDATSYEHAATEILRWASRGESRYVCIATVNNVIEAHDNPAYHRGGEEADLSTPNGTP